MEENTDNADGNNDQECLRRCKFEGVRYCFVFSGFLGMCTLYALRVNMSIAIVAMVNNSAVAKTGNWNYTKTKVYLTECGTTQTPGFPEKIYKIPKEGEFMWSTTIQGVIIGSFYYGYSISQIPGGRLSEIYSGKWIFAIGTVTSAILSLFIPPAARLHIGLLISIRAMQGLAQGFAYPAIYSLIGHWAPNSEKTLTETVILSGVNIGTVVAVPLTAALCNSNLFGGWPSAFYVIGTIGCLWCVVWLVTVHNTPQECPFITKSEVDYITSNQKMDLTVKLPPIPWLQILTFGPYWAIVFAQMVGDWTFFLILNDLPTFYATVLHFTIEENAFLSSFPFFLQTIVGCIAGYLSDEGIRTAVISTTLARKLCNAIGCIGSAIGLLISCVAGCSETLHISAFTFIMAVGGFFYCSYMVSMLDLSPEYAGTLVGIANTLSNLNGFLTPLLVGALTEKTNTLGQWRIVFIITIILLVLSTVIYHLFSTAEKQDWHSTHHIERVTRYRVLISRITYWRKT